MSFSSDTKDELLRAVVDKPCCMLAELAALTQTSGSLGFSGGGRFSLTYQVENAALARKLFTLLKRRFGATPTLHFVSHARLGGQKTCVLTLSGEGAARLLAELGMGDLSESGVFTLRHTRPRPKINRQCDRRAYLRASFLGAGTVTSPEKAYQIEWTASDEHHRQLIEKLLISGGLAPKHHLRRGREVIYLRGAQPVADALALMGASAAVMDLENTRITKEMRQKANRVNNCDEHNGERMLNAGSDQCDAIRLIGIQRGLSTLPHALEEAARLRLEHPDLSLTDLGRLMDPPTGKSGVNHRMRRLMEIAREIENEMTPANPQ